MKKVFLIALLITGVLMIFSGSALAGGWSTVDTETTVLTPDEGSWSVADDGVPHHGFSTSTNQCRVCHAVHMADPSTAPTTGNRIVGPTSWRLLRNANRTEECYYCHGPDGATDKQPYRERSGVEFRGEHTLGSTTLPDSATTTVPGGELTCGTCHNVHGADTVEEDVSEHMHHKILKDNPNPFNDQTVSTDTGAVAGAVGADPWTKFCSDCHDRNPNWDTNASADKTDVNHLRPNSASHVQGPAGDGELEVYGVTERVADFTGNPYNSDVWGVEMTTTVLGTNTQNGCRSCHRASDQGNTDQTFAGSAWPHRTVGNKLLFDDFVTDSVTQTTQITNDATRVLPRMDQLCTKCHRNNGAPNSSSTAGVGVTF